MRILVADDDPISRKMLERTLVRLGHEVIAVQDGLSALAALTEADGPRLAILDWMMPGMDGVAVCRALRQIPDPYVYVLLLTARDRREDRLIGLEAEADEFLTKPVDQVELRARLRSGERVLMLQERLLRTQDALQREATHDRLTGLWNRAAILDRVELERRRMARANRPISVAIVDVDHFKRINDTHGHHTGDLVLRETARRLREAMREYEHLGRYGGEEFLVVLSDCDQNTAGAVMERLRACVAEEPIKTARESIAVTISAGLVSTENLDQESAALISVADSALYLAKARGRNRVEMASVNVPVGVSSWVGAAPLTSS
ncbi:MAG: diguanylate cyclase [Acidobacteriota bacterium]